MKDLDKGAKKLGKDIVDELNKSRIRAWFNGIKEEFWKSKWSLLFLYMLFCVMLILSYKFWLIINN